MDKETLLRNIHGYARGAHKYGGVDLGWLNQNLNKLGADTIDVARTYKVYAPITGNFGVTIKATSREQAKAIFADKVNAMMQENGRKVVDCHSYGYNVYDIVMDDPDNGVQFYDGPEDADPADKGDLTEDDLRYGIREFIREGVKTYGWGYSYAQEALATMSLVALPALKMRDVTVPIIGTTVVTVATLEGDSDDDAKMGALRALNARQSDHIYVKPEELGEPSIPGASESSDDVAFEIITFGHDVIVGDEPDEEV